MEMVTKKKMHNIVRIIFCVLYFAIVIFLIYQASLDGSKSTEQSSFVGEVIGDAYEGISGAAIENIDAFMSAVRKIIGHFMAFMALGVCSTFAFLMSMNEGKYIIVSYVCNFLQAFFVAGITEVIQVMTPGRNGSLTDVFIDYAGFLSSALLISVIIYLVIIHKRKNNPKAQTQD